VTESHDHPASPSRFEIAIARFDQENSRDPNLIDCGGTRRPKELVYAEWLTAWVEKLEPNASEPLRLAARAQHLCRWEIPRNEYPLTRPGYLKWRQTLKNLHADKAAGILAECGYEEPMIARVRQLIRKELLPHDAETCVLEDALCLVFLEHQFEELAGKSTEEKVVNALRKSWGKMTERGHKFALTLDYTAEQKRLLELALKAP
jgi:hypothetical protein